MGHLPRGALCSLSLFVVSLFGAWGQQGGALDEGDPVLLLGLSLQDMLKRFGAPSAVYAVRGAEHWQDDVVFEYAAGDFYVFKDHVWQLGLKKVNGIRIGDAKMAVSMVHGVLAEDKGEYILVQVPNRVWPVMYRYNFDAKGKVTAIFLYRADY